jgi:hexosaminidase
MLVALTTSLLVLKLGAPEGSILDPRLEVVPTLREWDASAGYFRFHVGSRIVVDSTDGSSLVPTAEAIQEDVTSLTGVRPMIARGLYETSGDVFVSLDANDDEIGTEGYLLEIGDGVTIRAHTPAGIFYGSRSLLQMLTAGSAFFVPRGTSRDFPQYSERGFMLDVSSQFVSISLLKRYIRNLSWYKFNDLQLELNDNGGFRLNSPAFPGLAATDGSYTETEFRDLESYALVRGITITPEIDSPGHAAALTHYRPDIADPQNADFIDLRSPGADSFMASLWGSFIPWFTGPRIAIGADEYDSGYGDGYRAYVNFLDAFLRQYGKSVRMWGSLSREPGSLSVSTDITIQQWDTEWSNPMTMDRLGFPIINASSEFLYIVTPKSPWFADHIDAPKLYKDWNPTVFSRTDKTLNLSPGDPLLQGAMFDFWGYAASQDAFTRVQAGTPVVGEKLWNDVSGDVPYATFEAAVQRSGAVPGL